MKKFTLLMALILTAVFGVKTTASAQTYETEEQIEWINYAVTFTEAKSAADGIYLCHWDSQNNKYTFVNAGGEYGTQAIASNRGMKLTVSGNVQRNGNVSTANFNGTLYNPTEGVSLGMEPETKRVFLDRNAAEEKNWTLTAHTSTNPSGKTYYDIQNVGNQYLGIETTKNTLLVYDDNPANSYWLLIPRTAFRDVLLNVTHQTNIEVSGLFQNTRFVRYMDRTSSWQWWTISGTSHGSQLTEDNVGFERVNGQRTPNGTGLGIASYEAYRSMAPGAETIKGIPVKDHDGQTNITLDYAKSYGSFSAGEMKKPIIMRQQISGIRPGTYTITAQAFVSDDDNEIDNTNNSNIAFLFAAGTSGVNQGAEIPVLTDGDQTNFTTNFYNYHKDVLTASAPKYFRGNVAAGEYLATGGDYTKSSDAIYNPNTAFKTITLNVTVTAGEDGKTGTLTIGAAKNQVQGTLYIANIDVKYSGTYEFGIDSYGTDNTPFSENNTDGIDEYQYGYARQFNLVRDFNITAAGQEANAKWEALVLPVNLTATQVRNAFGNDVKLSKLVGLANNGNQIRFEAVDLKTNPNATVILAGDCYVIKVTKAPEVARNMPYKFDVYSNDELGDTKVPVTYYGPIYQIDGLTRTSKLGELIKANGGTYKDGIVTKTYTNEGKDLNFTGYFYWNQTAPKDAYVVSRGKMFYLDADNTWANLTGTMWKLEGPSFTGAKELSIDFGDGDITNGISGITVEGENNVNATGIYNLNGQKVAEGTSLNGLAKGIYIVNGRKHVVR
ncbi:hypothetical protein [Leyella lascolaii]|uniref:hypothetical protein n=1 Tax=Leyella lascolaii TaxID=1776379 RepID=UPI000B1F158E|nr:hypothetical protein [Leyella lascolaii]